LKRCGKVFRKNTSASILDLGDRVGLVEFHCEANALNDEVCEILVAACEQGATNFDALVIANRGRHFSAGSNLVETLAGARAGEWTAVDKTIRRRQKVSMTLKYGPIPVVAAPFGNALGGGCEICLHSARVVAAEETGMGLVETDAGLVPAGGGTKELGLRAREHSAARRQDLSATLKPAFYLITNANVSRNGRDAQERFFSAGDVVVPGIEVLIDVAKQVAIGLAQSGYRMRDPRTEIAVTGWEGIQIFQEVIDLMRASGEFTEHDAAIALHVATILCGGDQPAGTATEQHFLDLEREAFLSLLGTSKTQERIEYLLKENKPLRN
jgi:3-hydroxyacyl-CoA dehydrogenase